MNTETMIMFGDAVKALDGGKVGGYLVRFSTEDDPDISAMRDFFTSETDFDVEDWHSAKATVYYNHGLDEKLGKRKLAKASMKTDDIGVWVEAQLEMRDEYERAVYDLAKKGKLGWSSGSASHLIEREKVGDSHRVKHWPIVEASLTPMPAEPRNSAVTLKSLLQSEEEEKQSRTLEDHTKALLSELSDYQIRLTSLKALRAEDGRDLSDNARNHLKETVEAMKNIFIELEALLTEPIKFASKEQVSRLLGEFYENNLRVNG